MIMIVGSKKRMWLLSILRILEWSFWYMGIRFFWSAIPGMEKLKVSQEHELWNIEAWEHGDKSIVSFPG